METLISNSHGTHALTLEQLKEKEKANEILARNEHWKRCQDGSYECALSHDGFYEIWNKIKELEDAKENDIRRSVA